jgi:hypothetical protein
MTRAASMSSHDAWSRCWSTGYAIGDALRLKDRRFNFFEKPEGRGIHFSAGRIGWQAPNWRERKGGEPSARSGHFAQEAEAGKRFFYLDSP